MRLMLFAMCFYALASCSVTNTIEIPSKPCLIPDKGIEFNLCNDYLFYIGGIKYTAPIEFTTDLASIPRIFWLVDAPNDANTIAGAVIHDYLYSDPHGLSRKEIDDIFYDALILEGVSKFTAFKYWLGVRLFGRSHFSSYEFELLYSNEHDDDMTQEHYDGDGNNQYGYME